MTRPVPAHHPAARTVSRMGEGYGLCHGDAACAVERPAPGIGPAGLLVVAVLAALACLGVVHILGSLA